MSKTKFFFLMFYVFMFQPMTFCPLLVQVSQL